MEQEPNAELNAQLHTQRFMDTLSPEQETLWHNLCRQGRETGALIEDQMLSLWADETLPQVFRDRALLTILGTADTQKQLWEGPRSTSLGFSFGVKDLNSLEHSRPYFSAQHFASWLMNLQQHQSSENVSLIAEAHIFNWATEFYEKGIFNDSDFEDCLAQLDPLQARPWLRDHTDDLGWGPPFMIAHGTPVFPILGELLSPETKLPAASKTKAWALQKLDDWMKYQTDPGITLPNWLRNVEPKQGLELFRQLARNRTHKDAPYIDWKLINKGMDMFGAEVMYRSEHEGWDVVNKYENHQVRRRIVIDILGKRAVARANESADKPVQPLNMFQIVDAILALKDYSYIGNIEALKQLAYEQTVAMDAYIKEQEQSLEIRRSIEAKHANDLRIEEQATAQNQYAQLLDDARSQN